MFSRPAIKSLHGVEKARSLPADQIDRGDAAILERDLRRRLRLPAHFPLTFAEAQTGRFLRH